MDDEQKKRLIPNEVALEYLLKYPFRYCVPVIIGIPGNQIENASATLVTFQGRELMITNSHVIETYRKLREANPEALFQIGTKPFTPESKLIDEDRDSDIAVLDRSGVSFDRDAIELPELESYVVTEWPPVPVSVGDIVILGGWPRSGREGGESGQDVTFDSYSIAATDVTDVFPDRFHCKLDRSQWKVFRGGAEDQGRLSERDFSGLSGSPVMRIARADGRNELRPTVVGFIMEYNPTMDKHVITSAENVRSDGSLWHNTRR